ncbi:MAG: molybdate ABC transporter substrate-binding protein, partial [Candidatus Binatia bacterium]
MDGRLREALIVLSALVRRFARLAFPVLLCIAWTLGSGCESLGDGSAKGPAQAPRKVRVFAAASTTEVVEHLGALFEEGRVVASFGSSAALSRQIEDGAPADLFFSASSQWTGQLLAAGFVEGEEVSIAGNSIVCITPRGTALDANGPTELLDELEDGELVAIADAGVPAGEYARASLTHLDLLDAYRSRLVGLKDVRAVLHAVEQGEVSAGFVYATDARLGHVE